MDRAGKLGWWAGAAALAMGLTACGGKPVPPDKVSYVGHWEAKNMRLNLSAGGNVDYKRKDPGMSSSVTAPLQGFEGNNFKAGLPFLATTFVVSEPPHPTPQGWKMTVDGVELTRSEGRGTL